MPLQHRTPGAALVEAPAPGVHVVARRLPRVDTSDSEYSGSGLEANGCCSSPRCTWDKGEGLRTQY
eukprot:2352750-Amphidinium_carterae.1